MNRLRRFFRGLRRRNKPADEPPVAPISDEAALLEEYRRAGIPQPLLELGLDALQEQLGETTLADLKRWNDLIVKEHRPSQGMLASLPTKPR